MIGTSGNTNLRSQFINLKNWLKKSESLKAEVDKRKKSWAIDKYYLHYYDN